MRRWIFITIAIVLGLKLVAHIIVGVLNKPSAHLSKALTFEDRGVFDFLHWGNSPTSDGEKKALPQKIKPMPLPAFISAPHTLTVKDVAQMLRPKNAATDAVRKIEKEKDDKSRRKKRRKNLEKMANKTLAPAQANYYVPPTPPPTYEPAVAPLLPALPAAPSNTAPKAAAVTPVTSPTALATPYAYSVSKADAAYYLKNLIASQSPQLMKAFMSLYKSGQVTTTDFFGVLSSLVKTNTPALMQLAVAAAVQTPSAGAFGVLADASFVTDPTTLAQATQALQAYQTPSSLNSLLGVFRTTDLQAKSRAMDSLNQIIASITGNQTSINSLQSQLNQFVPLLQLVASQDPTLQAKALQTIQNLGSV